MMPSNRMLVWSCQCLEASAEVSRHEAFLISLSCHAQKFVRNACQISVSAKQHSAQTDIRL
jgi:hypothetical protein